MAELPSGTVTFLFSDIEGSTRLLQQLGEQWGDAVGAHNRILRGAFAAAGGREVDRQGDAFFAVFPRARNALAAAATAQRELAAHAWPEGIDLLVRMGVHTGEPAVGDEGYLGLDVVRAARICSLARGGQVLVSETTSVLVRGELDGLSLREVGKHRLKDIDEPERLFQLAGPGLRDDLPLPAPTASAEDQVMAVEGRELELANQALQRVRELQLGPLANLGPRIDQQVREVLARRDERLGEALGHARPRERRRLAAQMSEGRDTLRRMPGGARWAVIVAAAVGIVIALALVALLVWLVSLAI